MLNFDFYNPTQILFGKGRIADLNKVIPAEAHVLMLYGGGSIKQNGVYNEVITALGTRKVTEFTGIEPNPSYETLMKAVPATGSEMNNGGVVTRKSIKAKMAFSSRHCFPQFSVLDPTKTFTLPVRQIGNGAVDAFVHIMEQYLTYPVNSPVQDRFAEGLLLTLIEEGPKALANPEDYDVRANLMWCATMALNGLISTGVPQDWATHMIGHELTALHNIDHAQTLAIVLPSMLRVRKEGKRAKLLQFAERVWGLHEGDEDSRIETAISRMQDYFEQMGVKTRLSDYQLGSNDIAPILSALETHRMVSLGEKRNVTLDVSRQVLELSL
ncbi:MAG: iron-containing alcohol dehydrogenase [Burkholderiales bacterium]|nr:iron-containing alcohol dehydrogenase [Burkholderiales bacterium]